MEGNVKKYARATMTVNIFVDPANLDSRETVRGWPPASARRVSAGR